jgi:hypothetical protein
LFRVGSLPTHTSSSTHEGSGCANTAGTRASVNEHPHQGENTDMLHVARPAPPGHTPKAHRSHNLGIHRRILFRNVWGFSLQSNEGWRSAACAASIYPSFSPSLGLRRRPSGPLSHPLLSTPHHVLCRFEMSSCLHCCVCCACSQLRRNVCYDDRSIGCDRGHVGPLPLHFSSSLNKRLCLRATEELRGGHCRASLLHQTGTACVRL